MDRPPAPMSLSDRELCQEVDAWVAQSGERVVGVLLLSLEVDHLLLKTVAVAPGAQGQGIGSRLVSLAEQIAQDHHLPQVRLYTNEAMTENLNYYAARGYAETHRAVQNGYSRVFFAKHLQPR